MSDAQGIQTGHAGASRCSGAAVEPHSDAGDPERSGDAPASLRLNILRKRYQHAETMRREMIQKINGAIVKRDQWELEACRLLSQVVAEEDLLKENAASSKDEDSAVT